MKSFILLLYWYNTFLVAFITSAYSLEYHKARQESSCDITQAIKYYMTLYLLVEMLKTVFELPWLFRRSPARLQKPQRREKRAVGEVKRDWKYLWTPIIVLWQVLVLHLIIK